MDKVAILGASGFLGRALWIEYRKHHPDAIGTYCNNSKPALIHFDFLNTSLRKLRLNENGYCGAIIAGYIPQVDVCEQNKSETWEINVDGTLRVAKELSKMDLKTVFLSSDYVFDGRIGNYMDDSPTCPCTEYGRQKEKVEHELSNITDNYLIVRLSKIFSLRKNNGSFLDEMASKLSQGHDLSAASDQIFCPTYINDVVQCIMFLLKKDTRGLVNLCSPEIWTRYDLVLTLVRFMGISESRIKKISMADHDIMQCRPKNTSMLCKRLKSIVNYKFTPITKCVEKIAANWISDSNRVIY